MSHALLVVDVQNDFCEGGSLGVDGGIEVARRISAFLATARDQYAPVVATQDWHIEPGEHFAPPGSEPDFTDTWPVHCVAGSEGAALRRELPDLPIRFHKGMHSASYTGFDGVDTETGEKLAPWLRDHGVDHVTVAGLCTDFCVKETVLDAIAEGFDVTVLADLCAPVSAEGGAAALEQMSQAGATIAKAADSPADR